MYPAMVGNLGFLGVEVGLAGTVVDAVVDS